MGTFCNDSVNLSQRPIFCRETACAAGADVFLLLTLYFTLIQPINKIMGIGRYLYHAIRSLLFLAALVAVPYFMIEPVRAGWHGVIAIGTDPLWQFHASTINTLREFERNSLPTAAWITWGILSFFYARMLFRFWWRGIYQEQIEQLP